MNQTFLLSLSSAGLKKFDKNIQSGINFSVTGVAESQGTLLAARLAAQGKRVLLVMPNDLRAGKAGEDANQLLPGLSACLPGGEIDLIRGASSHDSSWRRLDTLTRAVSGEVRLMVTSAEALQQQMGDPDEFRASVIRLRPGDSISPRNLIEHLTRMGYERVEMVEGKGQCALRGDILDVYPPSMTSCLRFEFFDNEIDAIRSFDCISQRSSQNLREALISPACEVLMTEEQCRRGAERMRRAVKNSDFGASAGADPLFADLPPMPEDDEELPEYYDANIAPRVRKNARDVSRDLALQRRTDLLLQDADQLEAGLPFRRIRSWLPVICEKTFSLPDWFRPDVVLLSQPDQIRDRVQERLDGFAQDLLSALERGEAVRQQQDLLCDWETIREGLQQPVVLLSEILHGQGGIAVQDVVDLQSHGIAGFQGQIKLLAADCREWLQQGLAVLLLSGGVSRGQRLTQSLKEFDLLAQLTEEAKAPEAGQIHVLPVTLSGGFLWQEAGLCVVSDADIWGSGYRRSKSRSTAGEKIAAFTDLKKGDYVVHEDHGVGIYQGTSRIQSEGVWHEYLLIQYNGTDKLYVPVEQLERVQRYIGNPNQLPKLNSLGGGEWARQKSKVKAGLKTLAFDLTQLYAKRSQETGYAFSPDTPWQREFEDQFPYELTPDQAQSVQEITMDMESPRNMDRLLCGDVGYGKTEVSLRAAFKAVQDNKQVAILAPTTILAQQHYNTVIKRFERFPVNVEVISRFRTTKEIKEILQRLKEGRIDIIVGTHRLLNKDVQYKDLGLLIVDEEQRFGVSHKEIIKNMKNQMDVLTLSATPIPRTLHMSMVGIRDMSVLETPPEERMPVQTHVMDYSDALVRDAILRELGRGGQVYFLYNRVHSIEQFYTRLHQLVPEARIGVAHGQMKEHGLEDVMMDFYAGSYDVLLCTTIIESGLDVPTANTLIVFDADRFGLSQLYQLRGRVGRSSRQAYAYFTVRPDRAMSETARQRLSAIREFTEFGAGFRIAMRDLEIRGAGNILGPEQHGHLSTVGYDMYCKLIEEALQEAQGVKPLAKPLETRVDFHVDAYLPEDYIASEHLRMEMYKHIAAIATQEDREDVEEELIDRFGESPAVVDTLLDISQLRALANTLGVMLISSRPGEVQFRVDGRYVPDTGLLLEAMEQTKADLRAVSTPYPAIVLKLAQPRMTELEKLAEAVRVMKQLTGKLRKLEEAAAC